MQITEIYKTAKQGLAKVMRGEGLKHKTFRGGALLGSGSVAEQAARFGRNILLTRLLAPEAFGTMAIVLSAATLIQVMVDVGAKEALIQNPKGSEESHARAMWWLALGRAVSIYIVIYFLAPFVARFYANAELTGLTRLVTLSIVFDGAISPRAYVAMKEMKFRRWALVTNGGGILGVLITIGLSFVLRDVWALAIGFCSENAARCILSFILCPWRPRVPENLVALKDLLRFSKGLFGLAILNLIFSRADIFVIGKLFPSAQLGLYSMAIYLVQTPAVFLTAILVQTLLPAFSHVQDDNARMNRILLKVSSASLLFGLPGLVFAAFCGKSLLTVVYGARYGAASMALVFAACASFLNVLNAQITLMFYAKGLPQLHRRSVALMAAVVLVLVYPLVRHYGLWGGQFACLLAIAAGYALQVERIRKITGLRLSEYGKGFVIPAVASLVIAAAWFAAKSTGALAQPLPNILFGVMGCLVAYMFAGAAFLRGSREPA